MMQQPSLEVVTVRLSPATSLTLSAALSPLSLSPKASPLTRQSLNQFNKAAGASDSG